MPAYAYPITVNRKPKLVHYSKEHILPDDALTLALLRTYVNEDEVFSIVEDSSNLVLCVSGKRPETPEETELRVAKEEAYMTEYNRRKTVTD